MTDRVEIGNRLRRDREQTGKMKIQEERENPFFPIKKTAFLLIIFLFAYFIFID